jgi:hypothetical protein
MEVLIVFRLPRPALSILAGFVVVIASACSSSAAPTSGVAGGAGSPGAPTSPASAANPNDPNAIITAALAGESAVTSFHIEIDVSGTIKAAAIQAEAGSAGAGITSDVKLDGTSITGDVDVANQAADLSFTVPPMAMLGNAPLTGDLILKDSVLYYKVSLLGTKYTKMDLGSLGSSLGALSSSLPVAVPTAAASMAGLTSELSQLQAEMTQAGVTATFVGVDQIGGQDANHITISFPLATLNAEIAAAAASSGPAPTIDSASADVWIYKATSQLAKVEIKGASSTLGNLDLVMTITNYNAPVTINAPAAGDIAPST